MADRPYTMPPLGSDPKEVAGYLNKTIWEAYAQVRRPWLRQVEENVRALSGRQFDAYIDTLGEFVDLSTIFAPNDDRWRRTPVFNWLAQHWYQLALAKLTENVPLLTAMPATADQQDAMTAEVFDPVWRYEWRQMAMPERIFKSYGWLLASGRFVLKLRWDPSKGPVEDFYGPATLQLPGGTREMADAPYIRQGDGSWGANQTMNEFGEPGMDPQGDPMMGPAHRERLGDLSCDVVSPTSVLQPYGPELPYEKPWTAHEYLLSTEQVEARFGVTDPIPDQMGMVGNDLLLKMEYTSAYGMPSSQGGGFAFTLPTAQDQVVKGMVRIRELWHRECPQYPQGRLTICTMHEALYDNVNPYVTAQRSTVVVPFFVFDKPGFPFRQEGSSDLEALIPIARARNRVMGGLMDAVDYNEQPTLLINRNAVGDDQDEKFGLRGGRVYFDQGMGDPAKYLETPGLGQGGVEMSGLLRDELEVLGHANSSATTVPNDSRSGELLSQNRYDADRPWGTTLRLHSYGWERFGQSIMDILAVCMEDERILAISGEDNAAKYLTVRSEVFQGQINVIAMPESAIIESRSDKQKRMAEAFTAAAGMLPEHASMFLKALDYPDMNRLLRPGGEAYSLANRQLAEMVATGQLPPIIPEQDHETHIKVVTDFMQTLAFRNLPPPVQVVLRIYRQMHQAAGAQVAMQALQVQAGFTGLQQHFAQQAAPPMMGGAAPSAPGAGPTPGSAGPPSGSTPAGPSGGH